MAYNAFYQWFYRDRGFSLDNLRGFDDIRRIPIVTKQQLRGWELERRSTNVRGRFLINTGGTSGQPLEFYTTREVFANEWAHMHHVWARVGYRPADLKLTFRGKNLGSRVVRYNPVHNELVVSAYQPHEVVAAELTRLLRKHSVRYLHGYPSNLYEFASHCLEAAPDLLDQLRNCLRGILLGSEYPVPAYREVIERAFPVPCVSWYGHSEMAALAYEADHPLEYVTLQTYGYAEAVTQDDGKQTLVATSYVNLASPFIRYDTEDEIVPVRGESVLEAFRTASGRKGEFVVDRNGRRISLTALIFGRHHDAFSVARFIQVSQKEPGKATILVVPAAANAAALLEWRRLFDLRDVAMEFDMEVLDRPVRTPAGKTPLLVGKWYETGNANAPAE